MGMSDNMGDAVAFAGMVMMEGCAVGLTIMVKTAMARGMSNFVFVFYSNAVATFILLPSSLFFHRTKLPLFSFRLLQRFFFLGLTGIAIAQNLAFTGLNYSSPILVCGMNNMIPAISFMLSTILRMRMTDLRSSSSQFKSVGTLISIMGAIIITLYKGPPIRRPPLPSPIHQLRLPPKLLLFSSTPEHWVPGSLLLASASLSVCLWNIIQAETVKEYTEVMNIVSFYSFFGTIQCAIVALIAERDPSAWKLTFDLELIAIVLSAVFGSVIRSSVHVWCMQFKGPLYVAMFKPLMITVAVIVGSIFFGDSLHFGSVFGAFAIGLGYYTVTWGQIKEEMNNEEHGDDDHHHKSEKSPEKVLLLQNEMEV